jgi:cytochrome bd ubiquinol oxidase subunit II
MIHFWVAVLAISTLLYVLLDGFDLGVGMIFGATPEEAKRDAMMSAVAPIWDGNETWLVVTGVVLWGAFPLVYSIIMSAFYLPLLVMLAGLILRGVAFEYRRKSERTRRLWDASFAGGSFVAAFIQGLTVGALVEGLPIADGRYVGGANSAGSAPSRCFVASACALVMRCSAHAGLSGNARARFAKVHIVSSLTYPSNCSSS